ncbi:MAG: M28 family peptidase [Acidimicrobiia bacterium]|nr:M28 family peptidase [Acidimicrobiia bacterium]
MAAWRAMAPELSLQSPVKASIGEPEAYVEEVIRRLVDEYPPRRATSEAEREAHQWVAQELETLGLSTDLEGFLFNDNLYSVIALHFGVATAGAALSGRLPRLAAAMQLGAAASYWLDSTKRVEVLRRAFPYRPSQNLVARLPASRGPRLRVVFVSHIDAAFTGLLFDPRFIRTFTNKGAEVPYVSRSLEVATHSAAAGGLLSLARSVSHQRPRPLGRLQALLAIPSVLSLLLNADVVRRDHTVPGAADNLSGVAGTLLLAERMLRRPIPRSSTCSWSPGRRRRAPAAPAVCSRPTGASGRPTTRSCSGSTPCATASSSTPRRASRGWCRSRRRWRRCSARPARADDRFSDVRKFQVPVGSTDASPFAYAGYEAATLSCVDLEQGSPRHYHHPTDTPENTDAAAVVHAVDYAEAFTRRLTDSRLGSPSGH